MRVVPSLVALTVVGWGCTPQPRVGECPDVPTGARLLPQPRVIPYTVSFTLPDGSRHEAALHSGTYECGWIDGIGGAHLRVYDEPTAGCEGPSIDLREFGWSNLAVLQEGRTVGTGSFFAFAAFLPRTLEFTHPTYRVVRYTDDALAVEIEHDGWFTGNFVGRGAAPVLLELEGLPIATYPPEEPVPSSRYFSEDGESVCLTPR